MNNFRRSPRLAASPKPTQTPGKKTQLAHLFGKMNLNGGKQGSPNRTTGLCYDAAFAEHHCLWDPQFPECPERVDMVWDWLVQKGIVERCHRVPVRPATTAELELCHSKDYLGLIFKVQQLDESQLSEFSKHFDSIYFNKKSPLVAQLAAGSCVSVVQAVLSGEISNAFALIRPPGHHAMKSEACGYSIFNNVAIAARFLLTQSSMRRILIMDWDVHHGHGTQLEFYNDPRVLYISMHRYQDGQFWPHLRLSNYDCVGGGAGVGRNVNIPLNEIGMADCDYMAAFLQIVMPIAREVSGNKYLLDCDNE